LYEKIGFNDPDTASYFSKLVRNIAIEWACQLNISDCIEKSQTTLQEHLLFNSNISPDTKSTIYCVGVRYGSATTYDSLWVKFLTSDDQYERSLIISALGCTLDPAKIDSFLLNSIVDNPDIRHQEKSRILTAVIGNDDIGIEKAIDFISLNQVTIRQKYVEFSKKKIFIFS
jgi:aminopeptidase N